MKYAIIAAGDGSRLRQEGIQAHKPLVEVGGKKLIDRLISIFMENDAEDICVICNEEMTDVSAHLIEIEENGLNGRKIPLHFIVKSTPSSMHSFYELSTLIGSGSFILTTVDTIFREDEFASYVKAFQNKSDEVDGLMGVTRFVDDEKPLWISADKAGHIHGFYDAKTAETQFVSGGIYGLTDKAFRTLNDCIARGESRMRNFQRALIKDGLDIRAYEFGKIMDIDHKKDILEAEQFLKG